MRAQNPRIHASKTVWPVTSMLLANPEIQAEYNIPVHSKAKKKKNPSYLLMFMEKLKHTNPNVLMLKLVYFKIKTQDLLSS